MNSSTVFTGVRHGRGTVQFHTVRAPADREHGRDVLHRQRSAVRHLLPDAEADHAHVRGPQPPGVDGYVRRDHVLPVPGAAQLGPAEAGREHGAVPAAALLHHRVRAAHVPRRPAVPRALRPGAGAADVRREEHDGGVRPAARPVPDRRVHIPGPHVHEGGGRADVERAVEEHELLRRVDTEQYQDGRVRHTAQRAEDVGHVHWQHHGRAGVIQTRVRTVHVHVPAEGVLALVHGRGHGRDGVQRGRGQHERPGVRVPAIPGCGRRGGERERRVQGRRSVNTRPYRWWYFLCFRFSFSITRSLYHVQRTCLYTQYSPPRFASKRFKRRNDTTRTVE